MLINIYKYNQIKTYNKLIWIFSVCKIKIDLNLHD